jgi:hypothetical protein
MMMAGVSLSIGATSRAKLRTSCWTLMAAVKYAFSRAVTQGTTTRLVLDFEGRSLHIEETKGRVVLNREDETGEGIQQSEEELEQKGGEEKEEKDSFLDLSGSGSTLGGPTSGLGAMSMAMGAMGEGGFDMSSLMDNLAAEMEAGHATFMANARGYQSPTFKALPGKRGKKRELEGETIFYKVFTPHDPRAREEGRAFIYFFPSGMTEHSYVQLSDGEDRVYTVQVHPLSGKTVFFDEAVEPEEDLDALQEADE